MKRVFCVYREGEKGWEIVKTFSSFTKAGNYAVKMTEEIGDSFCVNEGFFPYDGRPTFKQTN